MKRRDEQEPTVSLAISPEKVCFIIVKAREFDVKDVSTDPDPGSNPSDDAEIDVLEDSPNDAVVEELTAFIDSLTEDEQVELVAIAWLGRGDYTLKDLANVRGEAAAAHNDATARYLLGMPLLGDFLEEGLSLLGHACEEFEIGRD
jgi:hypothetical protein